MGIENVVAPGPGQAFFAALQTLAAIALALALVFISLARHRLELGWPALIAAVAVALQAGASFLSFPIGMGAPAGTPGLKPGALLAALVTGVCLGLILLHASWALTPSESRAPLRSRLRAWFRTLTFNPVAILFGPVFQKEVRVAGRRRGTYIARTAYPLLLLGIAVLAYTLMTSELSNVGGAERLQRLQELAPYLALVIAWCQFAVLTFLAPVMTAPAICDERRQLTLAALMTTPMTSSQIIFGKLTSRLVLVLILALVSTPLLLAVRIYGGLEAEVIVATTCISVSAAVLGASLGLLYSVWHRRAATAAVFGLLTMALLMAGVIAAFVLSMVRTNLPPGGWVFGLSAPTAMFGATMALIEPPPNAADGPSFLREIWVTNTAVNLVLSVFACSAATLALRSVLRAEASGALAAASDRPRITRRRRRAAAAAGPATTDGADGAADADTQPQTGDDESFRTGAIRIVGDRPVLWREVRQASFGSRRRLIIVAVAIALGALYIYSRVPLSDEALHGMIGVIGLFVVILQACMASTASIAGEFEARTWGVLLTTPLTGREIIAGKFLGGLRRQWFILACLAAHFVLGVSSGYVHPVAVLHLGMICVSAAIMLTGTGLLLSLALRRSAAAGVANLLLALALWLVLPVGTLMVIEASDISRSRDLGDTILTGPIIINPFAMAVIALEPMVGAHPVRTTATLPYDLPMGRVGVGAFTVILAVTSSMGVAIGLACAAIATRLFRKVGGRTS